MCVLHQLSITDQICDFGVVKAKYICISPGLLRIGYIDYLQMGFVMLNSLNQLEPRPTVNLILLKIGYLIYELDKCGVCTRNITLGDIMTDGHSIQIRVNRQFYLSNNQRDRNSSVYDFGVLCHSLLKQNTHEYTQELKSMVIGCLDNSLDLRRDFIEVLNKQKMSKS